jgi:anti-sigma-K factor RskA
MRARGAGLHALVGAYVMDAISPADRASFERHLFTCEQCRVDVRGMREAAARLGAAASVPPRPELREQTMQGAARTRQLPPLVDEQRGRRLPIPRWPAGWRRHVESVRLPARSLLARVAVLAAVVLAVTATVFGLHMGSMQNTLTAAEQRDAAIADILGARDATTLTAQVTTGGRATVVMSHHADALVFIASGLTRLPASKAYELWLMGPAGDSPAGMLPPSRHGMTGPMVVGGLSRGEHLAMTVEPASGAPQPTSAPLVMVGLGG